MTREPTSLAEIAPNYAALVLDQWGVLHDGSTPYPGALDALTALHARGTRLAVLSNSGKRASVNARRISEIGFPEHLFETVITSGEALWSDLESGRVAARALYAIERAPGDASDWVAGSGAHLVESVAKADAILLMGLPDDAAPAAFDDVLAQALEQSCPVLCTNPDRASPRAGGHTVVSPGQLAHDHAARGGEVVFYGKPHGPVFSAVAHELGLKGDALLMIGDSLEHDIAGAHGAGWHSLFIRDGLHAAHFAKGGSVAALAAQCDAPAPTYTLASLGAATETLP